MVSPSAFGESGARTSVVALADLNDLQIELDISQTDFARLKMGQRAEIIPGSLSKPEVHRLYCGDCSGSESRESTVQVKVKVENPDEQLRPEMNARVNFLARGATRRRSNLLRGYWFPKRQWCEEMGGFCFRHQRQQSGAAIDTPW